LYYAEANKKERALASVRDSAIDEATASLLNAGKALTDFYKDNIKALEDFSKQAASRILKINDKISGARQDIEDRALDFKLERERDAYGKLRILDAEFRKQQAKAAALSDVGADPKKLKEFEAASERAFDLATRIRDLEKEGATGIRRRERAESRINKVQLDANKVREAAAKQTELAAKATDLHAKNVADARARGLELAKQEKAILADNKVTKQEAVLLEAIKKQRIDINEQLAKGADILKDSFGLDQDFRKVTDGLIDAMNQAHKDWPAEVALARAEFANMLIPLTFTLDPLGLKQELADELGVQRIEGEGEATFFKRVDTAAGDEAQRVKEVNDAILVQESSMKDAHEAVNRSLAESVRLQEAQLTWQVRSLQPLFAINATEEAGRKAAAERVALAKQQTAEGTKLLASYTAAAEMVRAGGVLHAGSLGALEAKTKSAFDDLQISKQQVALYGQEHTQLGLLSAENKKLRDLKEQVPERASLQVLEQVTASQVNLTAAKKTEQQVANEVALSYAKGATALANSVAPAQNTAVATANTADQAEQAATNTAAIGTGASGSIPAINATTNAMSALAAQAERAARAMAAASSGGGGIVQNPFNAAGGRLTRGSDRIPTTVAKGEMITNAKSSRRFFSELNAMNQGSQPVFREQGGQVTNVGDVNVSVNGGDTSQQTVREIAHALRREFKRGNIKLR